LYLPISLQVEVGRCNRTDQLYEIK
jgi:hypothetical protein